MAQKCRSRHRPRQHRADPFAQRRVETADEHALAIFVTVLTVNSEHDVGVTQHAQAHRLVEPGARDVQVGIIR